MKRMTYIKQWLTNVDGGGENLSKDWSGVKLAKVYRNQMSEEYVL